MYLITGKVDRHINETNGNKYLAFDSTELHTMDENKEVFKKYTRLWGGIKNEIGKTNGGKKGEYGKDFLKSEINTDNNLPLNKPLKLRTC